MTDFGLDDDAVNEDRLLEALRWHVYLKYPTPQRRKLFSGQARQGVTLLAGKLGVFTQGET